MKPVTRGHENYGRGIVFIDEPEGPDAATVMERLLGLLRAPGYSPPLRPTAALELLDLVKREDTSADAIVALLERDMVVAGRVLQVAGSPLYSSGLPARTLRDAIVRLGSRTMTEILFQVWTTTKVFRAPGYERPMDELRLHSTAVAHIARIVCRTTSHHDEYAFLCGLLHDVGVALALAAIAETSPRGMAPAFELLEPALREMHEQAGAILCDAWRLPEDVRIIIANHHHAVLGGRVHPIIAALRVAEDVAVELGLPGVDGPAFERAPRDALGLGDAALVRITEEARVALEPVLQEAAALRGAPPPRRASGSMAPPPLMGRAPTAPKPALVPLTPLGRTPTRPGLPAVRSTTQPGMPFARTPTQPNVPIARSPTVPPPAPSRPATIVPPAPRSYPGSSSSR